MSRDGGKMAFVFAPCCGYGNESIRRYVFRGGAGCGRMWDENSGMPAHPVWHEAPAGVESLEAFLQRLLANITALEPYDLDYTLIILRRKGRPWRQRVQLMR